MSLEQICGTDTRRTAVRQLEGRNGIDYVEVSDDGRTLHAYFLGKLPEELRPDTSGESPYLELTGGDGHPLHVLGTRGVVDPHPERDDVLEIDVDGPGDFTPYTLRLVGIEGLDPRYDTATFNFGIDCPTDLDCTPACTCRPDIPEPPAMNYLAKDYASFRRLILDRLAVVMPDWQERHAADLGITLVELLAYVGDYLSYYQDAVATEAYLETARQRISVRRHVRLVDYRLSEGCNARTWVCLDVDSDLELPVKAVSFVTGLNDALPAKQTLLRWDDFEKISADTYEVFEPLVEAGVDTLSFRAAHGEIRFYTWGRRGCHLPAGSTSATLLDEWGGEGEARRLALKEGDVLIFEEVRGPKTGVPADADPTRRHAVRLTRVTPGEDPVLPDADGRPSPYVEIEWAWADRLPFPFCLSATGPAPECALLENISVARGNALLVDHGRTLPAEDLGTVPTVQSDAACNCIGQPGEIQTSAGKFQAKLAKTPLTFRAALKDGPAAKILIQNPEEALAALRLTSNPPRPWKVQYDLIGSRPNEWDFAVEIDNEGTGHLRFGQMGLAASPSAGMALSATYRVGNCRAGNVGAEVISRLVLDDFWVDGVAISVRNPLPAVGGQDAEPIAEAKRYAPHRFRKRIERAIVAEDYRALAEEDERLQRAAARLVWTGSWYEADVAVDPLGRERVRTGFLKSIEHRLEPYRRIGHDLHVVRARYVPLDIAIAVCVKPDYQRGHVKAALMRAFGPQNMFHLDRLTFGEGVYLSPIVAAAQEVDGVAAVQVFRFQRFGEAANREIENGLIPLAHDEIAQFANDPSAPERGRLQLILQGGR